MDDAQQDVPRPHRVSIVIPVYQGELTLRRVIEEVLPLTTPHRTACGHLLLVEEVLLVFDHGPDNSAAVIRELAAEYDVVRAVWLSRNFGQHAATLAGMASSGGEWIVTMDEDGQHDPAAISGLLDTALRTQSSVVYARPTNPAPHGFARNAASRTAKLIVARALAGQGALDYQSFRLVLGETGRAVAAYAGSGVYLDVALGWIADGVSTSSVALRDQTERRSGYRLRTLLSHFWRMVLSSGTKGLRVVSILGLVFAMCGAVLVAYILASSIFFASATARAERGWTSTMVVVLMSTGAILVSLGVIAEYIGVSVNMAMGKPAYLITSDPGAGPLGRAQAVPAKQRAPRVARRHSIGGQR
jgi:polyisoprenyl-phosphate glycosyltransferase